LGPSNSSIERFASDHLQGTAMSTPLNTSLPLVGRTKEQVVLREELQEINRGHGRVVLLGGEAGIGKTALARDLLDEAASRGLTCLEGHCYDLTNTPPYGPWLDLAARYPDEPNLPSPPSPFARGNLEPINDQSALFADVWRFFREICANGPVMALFEDLHWADPASLEIVRHIAPRVSTLPLLLIITYRVDEVTKLHPFYAQLPSLLREARGLQLDLRRLDLDELSSLVASRYQLPPDDAQRLVTYLDQHAEGNPFFATELLRALEDEGLLGEPAARSLGDLEHLVLPSLLRQVIEGRVQRLGEAPARTLLFGAVIGQDVPIDLLATVAQLDEEQLLSIIEQATEAHLIEPDRAGTHFRFVHALTREALYESISPPRRRLMHQTVAETLLVKPGSDLDGIAYHLTQAGDGRAPEWLIAAGERAQRAYAWLTARERFADAAQLLESTSGDQGLRGWLYYRLARLQRYANPSDGIPSIDLAARIGVQTHDDLLTIESRYSRSLLRCFSGDFQRGVPEMRESIDALETLMADERQVVTSQVSWMADALPSVDWHEQNQDGPAIEALAVHGMHHRRGGLPWFLAASGHVDEAATMANRFIAAVEGASAMGHWVRSATGHAHIGLAYVSAFAGDAAEAREHFRRARSLYEPLEHHAVIAFTYLSELRDIVLIQHPDDLSERERVAREASAAIQRAGGAFLPGLSPDLALLRVYYLEGRWHEAIAIADATPEAGNVYLRREISTSVGQIARRLGDRDRAWAVVTTVLPSGPDEAPGATLLPEATELQLLAADLALDAGDVDLAQRWLEAHSRWLDWSGIELGKADHQLGRARLSLARGDEQTAKVCAEIALQLASSFPQPLVRLEAHRLLGSSAVARGDREAGRQHLQASLDLARSCAVRYQEGLTLRAISALAVLAGRSQEADEAAAASQEIFESLGVTGAPEAKMERATEPNGAQPTLPGLLAGLTNREIEVLRLVAQGMTDSAVAEALFISPRTVGQHLRSIYSKLDVSSRTAASRVAIDNHLL
jgi:DNA-binding NarL/FixJ family response regulator